ncbi:MAG: DUF4268 domain-containing protein [Bacteroidota bacterium]|nr:MAG: DUF4268 domain-containing protein [Bacteroidota bacterium]
MYSSEEKKQIRQNFWDQFKAFSNKRKLRAGKKGKWILDQTGISQLKLKFHFDEIQAWAGLEIDTRNLDKRIELYEKLEQLKSILQKAVPFELQWKLETEKMPGKTVSRVFMLKEGVNIYNQDCWREVSVFLYEAMAPLEEVFVEYADFIKYQ